LNTRRREIEVVRHGDEYVHIMVLQGLKQFLKIDYPIAIGPIQVNKKYNNVICKSLKT